MFQRIAHLRVEPGQSPGDKIGGNARPHPSPLPRGEGGIVPRFLENVSAGIGQTISRQTDEELRSFPLRGERTRVRADVPPFNKSKITTPSRSVICSSPFHGREGVKAKNDAKLHRERCRKSSCFRRQRTAAQRPGAAIFLQENQPRLLVGDDLGDFRFVQNHACRRKRV
jgi:hypothetical protein